MGTALRHSPMEGLKKRLTESVMEPQTQPCHIKLTYFPARGRAEISRLILAHAGVRYTDIRLQMDEFKQVKASLPYGHVPILEYHGTVLCESLTIAKFLADEFSVAGRNNLEKAQAQEIVEVFNGVFGEVSAFIFAPETEKVTKREKLLKDTLPLRLGQLEQRLIQRGGQFFAGNAITWADLMLVVVVDNLQSEVVGGGRCLEEYPKIKDLYVRMCALPNVKAWRETRPIDPMFHN